LERGRRMKIYKLTAFESNGEKLLDESIEAKNDGEAKKIGEKLLFEKNLANKTHRLVSPEGKLLLFHV
jgi:YhzD-like protein